MSNSDQNMKSETEHFSLMLHPHRSLTPRGFLILMSFIAGISFITGIVFLMMGAWPVLGFFGLDVLAIYVAFKMNFKSGRVYQVVEIKGDEIKVQFVDTMGDERSEGFQAYWSRVILSQNVLFLRCRGETLELGQFLTEEEKIQVKVILTRALHQYRHNYG